MGHLPKRIVFAALLAIALAVPVELAAQLFYYMRSGVVYSPAVLVNQAGRTSNPDLPRADINEIAQRRILHPYLGYAIDRRATRGMAGKIDPVQKREAGRFIVGVTGGSVGNQVCSALDDALTSAFANRGEQLDIVVVCMTIDGFKQPQQLMAVNYLLSIGAEFDAVINVDGFNDIVLPVVDNYEHDVYPFYPRAWSSFVNRRPSQNTILGAGEIAYRRQRQALWIERASTSLRGRSAIFGAYATWAISRDAARIAEIQNELIEEAVELPFEAQGPFEPVGDAAQILADSADLWARSSVLMKGVLDEVGTAYVHVLQPNQYVKGSKVLSKSEREIVFAVEHPYAKIATQGYPYLFDASQIIMDAGIAYFDATGIFREVEGDVYKDACCHVNAYGKKRIAEEAAAFLLTTLSTRDP